jgi:hypothetical protein
LVNGIIARGCKASVNQSETWNLYLLVFPNRIAPVMRVDLDGVRAVRFAPKADIRLSLAKTNSDAWPNR